MEEEPYGVLKVYGKQAESYIAQDDAKPFHTFYERPAVTGLFPPLEGRTVLDAGCGPGWYAKYLVDRGAHVTAVDAVPEMVAVTRRRLEGRAEVLQADLNRPLEFLSDESFDLVVCSLVLHYLDDWNAVFGEFARVLRTGGLLVLSIPHPFAEFQALQPDSYRRPQRMAVDKPMGVLSVYFRPLSALTETLAGAGFVIERLLEPVPTEDFRRALQELYESIKDWPDFLVARARKDRN